MSEKAPQTWFPIGPAENAPGTGRFILVNEAEEEIEFEPRKCRNPEHGRYVSQLWWHTGSQKTVNGELTVICESCWIGGYRD